MFPHILSSVTTNWADHSSPNLSRTPRKWNKPITSGKGWIVVFELVSGKPQWSVSNEEWSTRASTMISSSPVELHFFLDVLIVISPQWRRKRSSKVFSPPRIRISAPCVSSGRSKISTIISPIAKHRNTSTCSLPTTINPCWWITKQKLYSIAWSTHVSLVSWDRRISSPTKCAGLPMASIVNSMPSTSLDSTMISINRFDSKSISVSNPMWWSSRIHWNAKSWNTPSNVKRTLLNSTGEPISSIEWEVLWLESVDQHGFSSYQLEAFVMNEGENRPCIVHGASGCGKTSVLAKVAKQVGRDAGFDSCEFLLVLEKRSCTGGLIDPFQWFFVFWGEFHVLVPSLILCLELHLLHPPFTKPFFPSPSTFASCTI